MREYETIKSCMHTQTEFLISFLLIKFTASLLMITQTFSFFINLQNSQNNKVKWIC